MTSTEEVLNRADSSVEALEAQLSALDELTADAGIAQKTVETVAAEIKVVHDNPNGIEMKVRSNRLCDLTATEKETSPLTVGGSDIGRHCLVNLPVDHPL